MKILKTMMLASILLAQSSDAVSNPLKKILQGAAHMSLATGTVAYAHTTNFPQEYGLSQTHKEQEIALHESAHAVIHEKSHIPYTIKTINLLYGKDQNNNAVCRSGCVRFEHVAKDKLKRLYHIRKNMAIMSMGLEHAYTPQDFDNYLNCEYLRIKIIGSIDDYAQQIVNMTDEQLCYRIQISMAGAIQDQIYQDKKLYCKNSLLCQLDLPVEPEQSIEQKIVTMITTPAYYNDMSNVGDALKEILGHDNFIQLLNMDDLYEGRSHFSFDMLQPDELEIIMQNYVQTCQKVEQYQVEIDKLHKALLHQPLTPYTMTLADFLLSRHIDYEKSLSCKEIKAVLHHTHEN